MCGKKTPFGGFLSHKGYTFSAILSDKEYASSEICSKVAPAKKIHKKGPQKYFSPTKGIVFHNFPLTKGMLFPNCSLTKGPILNINTAHTYHFWPQWEGEGKTIMIQDLSYHS